MHLKPYILLEDCLPYPLPPSQMRIQKNRNLLYSRVLGYIENEIEKIANLEQPAIPDHLLLLPFNPAITMRKRLYNEQGNLDCSSINKKVRQQS